jgi:hypothetical protein
MDEKRVIITGPHPVNYLKTDLIDDDIKAIYDDPLAQYFSPEPLVAQLIVELRKTQEALRDSQEG